MPSATIGRIIKHSNGIGFKVTFNTKEEAQKYKDEIYFIISVDGYKIDNKGGCYDKNQKE
jgi:hypothetical protein